MNEVELALDLSLLTLTDSPAQLDRDAAELFRTAGALPGTEFDAEIAAALVPNTTVDRAHLLLSRLRKAHLLEPGRDAERVRFHDLTADYAAKKFAELPPRTRRDTWSGLVEQGRRNAARLAERIKAAEHLDDVSETLRELERAHPALLAIARAVAVGEIDGSVLDRSVLRTDSAATMAALIAAHECVGHSREVVETAEVAILIAQRQRDQAGQLDAFLAMSAAYLSSGQFTRAAHCLRQSIELNRVSYSMCEIYVLNDLSPDQPRFSGGDYYQLARLWGRRGLHGRQALVLLGIGRLHADSGEREPALQACGEAWNVAEQHGHPRLRVIAWNRLGRRFAELGEYGDAIHHCLLYTSPSPRDRTRSRMPSSA